MAMANRVAGPNIRQTRKCLRYRIKLHSLLYQVMRATIVGCVRYYIRLHALLSYVGCATMLG